MVCLHCSASSSGQWQPLVDRLADRFRLLWIDDQLALLEPVFERAGERFSGALAIRAVRDAIDAPSLLLTGSASTAAARALAAILKRSLSRVTVEELPGAGHMAPVTAPERVNPLIERFLSQA